jgi:cysteine sulfinate desulfinase/cysteine desulfurase-like protein
MGYSRKLASECVRFSLGRFSDAAQVDEAVGFLAEAIAEARSQRD